MQRWVTVVLGDLLLISLTMQVTVGLEKGTLWNWGALGSMIWIALWYLGLLYQKLSENPTEKITPKPLTNALISVAALGLVANAAYTVWRAL
jgi:hypothetical protein